MCDEPQRCHVFSVAQHAFEKVQEALASIFQLWSAACSTRHRCRSLCQMCASVWRWLLAGGQLLPRHPNARAFSAVWWGEARVSASTSRSPASRAAPLCISSSAFQCRSRCAQCVANLLEGTTEEVPCVLCCQDPPRHEDHNHVLHSVAALLGSAPVQAILLMTCSRKHHIEHPCGVHAVLPWQLAAEWVTHDSNKFVHPSPFSRARFDDALSQVTNFVEKQSSSLMASSPSSNARLVTYAVCDSTGWTQVSGLLMMPRYRTSALSAERTFPSNA